MSVELCEEKMKKSIESLEDELTAIRAGRANPKILDKVMVENYGVLCPLNQVCNITVPEARVILIQPWDVNMLKEIEKSILASDIGLNPTNDGKCIRLVFPELTEERRVLLTKDIKKKGESAKVSVRNTRREGMDLLKKMQKNNEITEDDLSKLENDLQKVTDSSVAEIDKVIENKNKEILSI